MVASVHSAQRVSSSSRVAAAGKRAQRSVAAAGKRAQRSAAWQQVNMHTRTHTPAFLRLQVEEGSIILQPELARGPAQVACLVAPATPHTLLSVEVGDRVANHAQRPRSLRGGDA